MADMRELPKLKKREALQSGKLPRMMTDSVNKSGGGIPSEPDAGQDFCEAWKATRERRIRIGSV